MDDTVSTALIDTALVDEYYTKFTNLRAMAVIEGGRVLAEFKAKVKEESGNWGELLERLDMSRDTADRYICAHRVFGDRADNLRHLGASAILLLAAPSTPDRIREQVINRSQAEKLKFKDVKEAIDSAKPPKSRRERDEDEIGDDFDFIAYDVRNGNVVGGARKGHDGRLDIYIEDGPQHELELWFAMVPPGKRYNPATAAA